MKKLVIAIGIFIVIFPIVLITYVSSQEMQKYEPKVNYTIAERSYGDSFPIQRITKQFFLYYSYQGILNYYSDDKNSVVAEMFFMPKKFFGLYMDGGEKFDYIDTISGKSDISNPYEIIVDKNFYDLLSPKKNNEAVTVTLPLENKNGDTEFHEFKVVSVVSNNKNNVSMINENNHTFINEL